MIKRLPNKQDRQILAGRLDGIFKLPQRCHGSTIDRPVDGLVD